MKKALVIIIAIALIGGADVYASHHKSASGLHLTSGNSGTSQTMAASSATINYKDGDYTGSVADTPYGTVQVEAIISGGKISDIQFLQMPTDQGHSQEITAAAEPLLKETTLQKQSAQIDFVSGATSTSYGYEQSLQAALDQATVN